MHQPAESLKTMASTHHVFSENGEMGQLMRSINWSTTPIGEVTQWPEDLKSSLRICLNCQYPMAIYWGQEGFLFYNDAWRPIVGDKHPWALGRPGNEVWSEIWEFVGPVFEKVLQTGKGSFQPNSMLPMKRYGYTEECYFDYSFNPIIDIQGNVLGILNVVTETTYRVLNERRTKLLQEIAARATAGKSIEEVCALTIEALSSDSADVPFALLYLLQEEGTSARLYSMTGLEKDTNVTPETFDLTSSFLPTEWPIDELIRTNKTVKVNNLASRFKPLPGGIWAEATQTAVILPFVKREGVLSGFLIAGVNPRRLLDADYQVFYDFLANTIETIINHARSYEEEKKRIEMLVEIDHAKTVFFNNVSHEFRTPLTLMLGPLEVLLRTQNALMPPGQKEQLELIHRNALRLLKLVNSLLDFSRMEAKRTQAVYEPTDLAQFTTDLASAFCSTIEKAGLIFTVEMSKLTEPVYIDKEMWEKIIFNLLSNAFKFTLQGEIKITLRQQTEKIQLQVHDTGVGIPFQALPHLFERFYRVEDSRGRSYEGSGIGLSLVHDLVKLHGGTITAASQPEAGTIFTIEIPLGVAHLPAEHLGKKRENYIPASLGHAYIEEAAHWSSNNNAALPPEAIQINDKFLSRTEADYPVNPAEEKIKILVADDNADMRQYLQSLLAENAAYQIDTIENGKLALQQASVTLPDLIISDVMMPEMNGFELIAALRQQEATRSIPIILLSARAGEEAHIEGLQAGADDYLVKPFSAKEFLARVNTQIELSRLRQQLEAQVKERTQDLLKTNEKLKTEVAERNKTIHLLEISERRYRTLAETTHSIVWSANALGEFVIQQEQWQAFTGQSWPDHQGLGWINAIHANDRERFLTGWQKALQEKTVYQDLVMVCSTAGYYKYLLMRATPVTNEHGEVEEWIGTGLDMQNLKQTEDKLKQLNLKLNQALDASKIGIWHWDLITNLVSLDSIVFELFGLDDATYHGTLEEIFEKIHPDDRKRARQQLDNCIANNLPYEIEYRIQKDKTIHYIAARGKVIYDENNKPLHILGTYWDITLKKERLQLAEMVTYRQKLEEFIDTVCHEIRNPLNGIYGGIELIQEKLAVLESLFQSESSKLSVSVTEKFYVTLLYIKEQIEAINQSAQQQKIIVDDVLDLSKLESNKVELNPEPFQLKKFIKNLVQMFMPQILQKGLKIIVDVPEEPIWLKTDRHRLSQIVINLLSNAVKFTAKGHIQVTCVVNVLSISQICLQVKVRDTGIGMTEEEHNRLFDRFVQANPRIASEHGGSGLGLVISKKLVECMGGTIEVQSKKWQGTEFCFTIIADQVSVQEQQAYLAQEKKRPAAALLSTTKAKIILIVDDNPINQSILIKFLEPHGYFCQTANNGIEALNKTEHLQFDLIFMDIEMPLMNGLEATQRIRMRETERALSRVTIIGLSGNARQEQIRQALEIGMDDYITKPFLKNNVLQILDRHLIFVENQSANKMESIPTSPRHTNYQQLSLLGKNINPIFKTDMSTAIERFKVIADKLLKQGYPFLVAQEKTSFIIKLPVDEPYRPLQLCQLALKNLAAFLAEIFNTEVAKKIQLNSEQLTIIMNTDKHTEIIKDFLQKVNIDTAMKNDFSINVNSENYPIQNRT